MTSPLNSRPELDTDRATELVDAFGERFGRWTARLGLELMKSAAIARENAEDILAEARNMANRPEQY
ncbi:MAG: hypothetical protein ACR2JC_16225 [Chloroflexota bacterium]|nr:MAG: hypothetical protein DLM70_12995 [Chloroflexota bacterium]